MSNTALLPEGGEDSSPVTRQLSKGYATIGLKGRLRASRMKWAIIVHSASLQGHVLVEASRIYCVTEHRLWDSAWLPGTVLSKANRLRLLLFPIRASFETVGQVQGAPSR